MKTIFSRLSAETPKFWKGAQLLFVALAAIALKVATYHIVPVTITDEASVLFSGCAILCQFACDNPGIIASAIADPSILIGDIPELMDKLSDIHAIVSKPVPVSVLSSTVNGSETAPQGGSGVPLPLVNQVAVQVDLAPSAGAAVDVISSADPVLVAAIKTQLGADNSM